MDRQLTIQVENLAKDVTNSAKSFCPVLTGELRNSIHYTLSKEKHSFKVTTPKLYAKVQEFLPFHHTVPREGYYVSAYMRRAVQANRSKTRGYAVKIITHGKKTL